MYSGNSVNSAVQTQWDMAKVKRQRKRCIKYFLSFIEFFFIINLFILQKLLEKNSGITQAPHYKSLAGEKSMERVLLLQKGPARYG